MAIEKRKKELPLLQGKLVFSEEFTTKEDEPSYTASISVEGSNAKIKELLSAGRLSELAKHYRFSIHQSDNTLTIKPDNNFRQPIAAGQPAATAYSSHNTVKAIALEIQEALTSKIYSIPFDNQGHKDHMYVGSHLCEDKVRAWVNARVHDHDGQKSKYAATIGNGNDADKLAAGTVLIKQLCDSLLPRLNANAHKSSQIRALEAQNWLDMFLTVDVEAGSILHTFNDINDQLQQIEKNGIAITGKNAEKVAKPVEFDEIAKKAAVAKTQREDVETVIYHSPILANIPKPDKMKLAAALQAVLGLAPTPPTPKK